MVLKQIFVGLLQGRRRHSFQRDGFLIKDDPVTFFVKHEQKPRVEFTGLFS